MLLTLLSYAQHSIYIGIPKIGHRYIDKYILFFILNFVRNKELLSNDFSYRRYSWKFQ